MSDFQVSVLVLGGLIFLGLAFVDSKLHRIASALEKSKFATSPVFDALTRARAVGGDSDWRKA